MFSHVFEQNYWHIVAACLLLVWTLFNAFLDGVFSPKKWRAMPTAKKRMYLAFLFIGKKFLKKVEIFLGGNKKSSTFAVAIRNCPVV